jgi:hypothetical protein
MTELFARINAGSRLLSWTGWIHIALAVVFILCSAIDSTKVYGINAWVKPLKFSVSIAVYVWTMALLFAPLGDWWAKPWLGRGIAISMFVEIALIVTQSARGVPSHFNNKTPFDAAVFGVMGLMIVLNTLLAFGVFLGYLRRGVALDRLMLAGVRVGLVIFIMGSLVGVIMVVLQGHTVGAGDGGPGLPFLNWSTMHGDLRVAHAVGLHALQAIPLAAWWISTRLRGSSRVAQTAVLMVVSLAYLGGLLFTLRQALAGKPLVGM